MKDVASAHGCLIFQLQYQMGGCLLYVVGACIMKCMPFIPSDAHSHHSCLCDHLPFAMKLASPLL